MSTSSQQPEVAKKEGDPWLESGEDSPASALGNIFSTGVVAYCGASLFSAVVSYLIATQANLGKMNGCNESVIDRKLNIGAQEMFPYVLGIMTVCLVLAVVSALVVFIIYRLAMIGQDHDSLVYKSRETWATFWAVGYVPMCVVSCAYLAVGLAGVVLC